MLTRIRKWGNSAAIRLPTATLAKAGLALDSAVEIRASDGTVVVTAVTPAEYTLDDLLDACPPTKMALSEEDRQWLDSDGVGEEAW